VIPAPRMANGVAVGWKYLRWDRKKGELHSPVKTMPWEIVNKAECRASGARASWLSPHLVPGASCLCGIHAYSTVEQMLSDVSRDEVLVLVHGWGNVVPHAKGFRAEFVQPITVVGFLDDEKDHGSDIQRLVSRYECDFFPVPFAQSQRPTPLRVTRPNVQFNPEQLNFQHRLEVMQTLFDKAVQSPKSAMNKYGIELHGQLVQAKEDFDRHIIYREAPGEAVLSKNLSLLINGVLQTIFHIGGGDPGMWRPLEDAEILYRLRDLPAIHVPEGALA
jgi:hypothetical protein